ncbi:transposase, partial [Salmonella enterica]|uniref:transposase n=1 Tax=Salmonella enterica TaxID=28901 RepID=UPI003D76996B
KSCPHCGGTSLKKYAFSTKGERRMYCPQCNKTFISSTAIRRDARQENLATLIGEEASLVEIRAALAINSTGFSRELQKLSRRGNQAERDFVYPAFDIAMSTRAFRVKFIGGDSSLYVL